jgi:uncharacterized membrane protein YbaN (DUF454 family)
MKFHLFRHLSPRVRILLGVLSLILGLAGLILPLLQGWLFIGIGLILLSRDVPFFRRLRDRLEQRFPRLARIREGAKRRFTRKKG